VSAIRQEREAIQPSLRTDRSHGGWLASLLLTSVWLVLPSIGIAAEGTAAGPTEYRDIPGIGSRNLVWIVAQLHLAACRVRLGGADLCLAL
jgi:cytochrome bd ubiquinol oxidase subunit I